MSKTMFSFDGKGINLLSSEYAPRVATFTKPEYADDFGRLLEAAPELLEVCRILLAEIISHGEHGDALNKTLLTSVIHKAGG